jgi:hypothetical protein
MAARGQLILAQPILAKRTAVALCRPSVRSFDVRCGHNQPSTGVVRVEIRGWRSEVEKIAVSCDFAVQRKEKRATERKAKQA